jgi:hypothetical protein
MHNAIDICSFIPVSGCVDIGHSTLLCSRAYNAAKTALTNGYNKIQQLSKETTFFAPNYSFKV